MFLKNKNIIFKIRRPKVTDYAALNDNKIGRVLCSCANALPLARFCTSRIRVGNALNTYAIRTAFSPNSE